MPTKETWVSTLPLLNTYIDENNLEVIQTNPYAHDDKTVMVIYLIKTFDNGGISVSQFDTYSDNPCDVADNHFQKVEHLYDYGIQWG